MEIWAYGRRTPFRSAKGWDIWSLPAWLGASSQGNPSALKARRTTDPSAARFQMKSVNMPT